MLSCLDKADLNVMESLNKQVVEEREKKRPSEIFIEQLHQSELEPISSQSQIEPLPDNDDLMNFESAPQQELQLARPAAIDDLHQIVPQRQLQLQQPAAVDELGQIQIPPLHQNIPSAQNVPLIRPPKLTLPNKQLPLNSTSLIPPSVALQFQQPPPLTFVPTLPKSGVSQKRIRRGGVAQAPLVPMVKTTCSGNLCSVVKPNPGYAARNKVCTHCGQSFTRQWNLDRHIADIHGRPSKVISRAPNAALAPLDYPQIGEEAMQEVNFEERPALEYIAPPVAGPARLAGPAAIADKFRRNRLKAQTEERARALKDTDSNMYSSWGPKGNRKRLQPHVSVNIRKDPYSKKGNFEKW